MLTASAIALVVAGVVAVTAVDSSGSDDAAAAPTPSATATHSAAPAPSASPTPAPTTPSASPTPSATPTATRRPATHAPAKTEAPAPPPKPKSTGVTSVSFTSGLTCTTSRRFRTTATAHVRVSYEPAVSGTVRLVWWRNSSPSPKGAETMRPEQPGTFPKGSDTYDFTGNYTFTPEPGQPYVGVTVYTDPVAKSGSGTSRALRVSPATCPAPVRR